ncbi:MAG: Smr/MutS family protein [Burkholderiales bacterium]|nr:Smr/MutS family protein [Burkholderiales bacterium]
MPKRPPSIPAARGEASSRADDSDLFREAVGDVRPLGSAARVLHARRPPKPIPQQRLIDEREALIDSLSDHIPLDARLETGEELAFARNGISRQVLRALRSGRWVIQDELDLHGLTVAAARPLLGEFLNACTRRDVRCVRIIHGKGLRSKNREPVLKQKVASWLMQRNEILAFCQARGVDGGSGAVVVLLKAAG